MFELKNQSLKLAHCNGRAEKHGDKNVLAVDLKFELKILNTKLDEFSAGLMRSLYEKKVVGEVAELFPGHLPDVRYPQLPELKWEHEYAGYTLRVEHGIDDGSDIVLTDCDLSKFNFKCQDGGTVVITFSVQCHPTDDEAGHLLGKIQSEVTIDLTPPDPNAVVEQKHPSSLFNDDEMEQSREDAITDAFINGAPETEEEA